ncbi:MAG: hypothetical protein HC927_12055 [Deltaproteobacteria bacterium]|nr:hypothetical protein [Deltaproteobacteria bacterium]
MASSGHAVQVSYPGVYVQEIPSGSRTITGVSTSIALFIGMADQGPMDEPVRTLSYADFERSFGTTNNSGELHDQVRQFFLNGGSQCWVIRIAEGASSAKVELAPESGNATLQLAARSAGTIGASIRARVDYDTAEPEQTFNLRLEQTAVDGNGVVTVVASELYKNLTFDPNSSRYVIDVLNQQSALVEASLLNNPTAVSAYSLWGVWEATEDAVAALNTVLAALPDGEGKFQISVDGSPFQTVVLDGPMANLAAVQTAIDTALTPVGKTATVDTTEIGAGWFWKITSGGTGGAITFAPVSGNDFCKNMQVGTAFGGIDVGGWAHARPAPNGIFGRLVVGTPATLATNLGGLVDLTLGEITTFTITDSQGADAIALAPALPAAAATTLAGVKTMLSALAGQVNADSNARWTAAVNGYRIVFLPKTGVNATDFEAFVGTGVTEVDGDYFWADGTGNVQWYELGGYGSDRGDFQEGSAAGSNGSTPGVDNYTDAFTIAKRDIDLFNLLVLPQSGNQGDSARKDLWGPASVFAKEERAFLLVDPPTAWTEANEVTEGIADLRVGVATDHAAVYWPRLKVASNGTAKTIDPAGTIAGIMARIDGSRGVWKAPAGLEATALGVRGVQYGMSDGENGLINPQAVNALRAFPSGIVSWGARTMVGFDNSGNDDYKYVPVRRLSLYIAESLYRGLQWAVFEPNDEPLWRQLRQSAGGFMNNLFRLGAFAGARSSDAYFVKVDRETTTQNDINLGIVNVVIGFAPLKPAEFVVLTIQQKAGEVQV